MNNQRRENRIEDLWSRNQWLPGDAASNDNPSMDKEVTIKSTSNNMLMCVFDVFSIDLVYFSVSFVAVTPTIGIRANFLGSDYVLD